MRAMEGLRSRLCQVHIRVNEGDRVRRDVALRLVIFGLNIRRISYRVRCTYLGRTGHVRVLSVAEVKNGKHPHAGDGGGGDDGDAHGLECLGML